MCEHSRQGRAWRQEQCEHSEYGRLGITKNRRTELAGVIRKKTNKTGAATHPVSTSRPLHMKEKSFVPNGELDIAQQRVDVLEEFSSRAQGLTDQAILFIYQVENGVE